MTQKARPVADSSVSGWGNQPLYAKINGVQWNDASSFITSAGSAQGDSFEVDFPPLAIPSAGPQTLTVRLMKTDTGNLPVTVTLREATRDIATRILRPGTGFANRVIVLTPAEGALETHVARRGRPAITRGPAKAGLRRYRRGTSDRVERESGGDAFRRQRRKEVAGNRRPQIDDSDGCGGSQPSEFGVLLVSCLSAFGSRS